MKKLKGFVFLSLVCLVLLYTGVAHASDAIRVYLELSDSASTAFPTGQDKNYLRGRVTFLDANNELATTFAGFPITDAQLILQSLNYGSSALFSTKPATNLDLMDIDWESASAAVLIALTDSWQEFAVNYDNINQVGNDTIVATLKQGASTISSQATVSVEAPLANCYVVRTGGLSVLPGILDEMPPNQEDGGSTKRAGDITTVEVFAAFYNSVDKKYYFTTNLPEGAEKATIGGGEGGSVTLANGYAKKDVHVISVTDSKAVSDVEDASDFFQNGKKITFSASIDSKSTRWIGNRGGDVNEDEHINAKSSLTSFNTMGVSSFKNDSSVYRPNQVNKIIIVGLPVNEVTSGGSNKVSGFAGTGQTDNLNVKISPDDAYNLLEDPTKKPSSFKVPGVKGQTHIYGAIAGYDLDGNPAAFAQGSEVTFSLKKEGGASVNSSMPELRALPAYSSGAGAGTTIKTKYAYQAFLPFQITVTASTADGSFSSITNLYLSSVVYDGTSLSNTVFSNIDEESEGIDFIAQDTVASITLTDIDSLDGGEAGDDAEVNIEGKGEERSFTLRVISKGESTETSTNSGPVDIGTKGSSSPDSSVQIPNDKGNTAREDVALFTSFENRHLFFVFQGEDLGTNVLQFYPPGSSDGISISAANPGDFEASSIRSSLDEINVMLDDEQKHNTVALDGIISVTDIFSNSYGASGTTLEDSDITGKVYLPEDAASNRVEEGPPLSKTLKSAAKTASDTEFPGTSVKLKGNAVEVGFSLNEITPERESAILRVTSKGGLKSDELTINIKRVSQVALNNIFVPVPGVSDTPVEVFLVDQNKNLISPITVTAANSPTGDGKTINGNSIEVGLSSDNGTVSSSKVDLTTVSPKKVFSVKPDNGKTIISVISATDNYGDAALVLNFVPDFDPPFVGEITPGNCNATIEVVDNQAVDISGTEVSVLNQNGDDITGTLTRSDSDNIISGSIMLSDFPEGDAVYTLLITARDRWNNENEVSRSFSVSCVPKTTGCVDVQPAYGLLDTNLSVIITGNETNFADGVTDVSFSCNDVTVNKVTVNSSTELEVSVSIGSAPPEPTATRAAHTFAISSSAQDVTPDDTPEDTGNICDITITTGSDIVTCDDAFQIFTEEPEIVCGSVDPSTGKPGTDALNVTISLVSPLNLNSSLIDSSNVIFECDGITVQEATLSNGTGNNNYTINATISIADDAAECTGNVTLNLSGKETVCTGSFSVEASESLCSLTTIKPQSIKTRPKFRFIKIKGENIDYNSSSSSINFEGANDKISVLYAFMPGNKSQINAFIWIKSGLEPGEYPVTVETGDVQCSGVSLVIE